MQNGVFYLENGRTKSPRRLGIKHVTSIARTADAPHLMKTSWCEEVRVDQITPHMSGIEMVSLCVHYYTSFHLLENCLFGVFKALLMVLVVVDGRCFVMLL